MSRYKEGISNLLLKEAVNAKRGLNEILKDSYREAVKEKAAGLGNVVSVSESSQDGAFRIRVEIQNII